MLRTGSHLLAVVTFVVLSLTTSAAATDTDSDGVVDTVDNCVDVANNQYDVDLDGYGNACDCDYDGNGVCGSFDDTGFAWCAINQVFPACEVADANGDGVVDTDDSDLYDGITAPGPSGLSCAGGSDCGLDRPIVATPAVPIVQVYDRSPYDGVLDQDDIDAALTVCGDGCNLLFLADTYEDVTTDIGEFDDYEFAMYGYGKGVTTLRSPLFGNGEWDLMIEVTADAPAGIVIQGMTMDGRKGEQQPPTSGGELDPSHSLGSAIGTGTSSAIDRPDGRIADLEIHDFVRTGIYLDDATEWIIEDNEIRDIGCHQAPGFYAPCGSQLGGTNPWDLLDDPQSSSPDRKTVGFGINVARNTNGTIVRNNVIERVTKLGIQVFAAWEKVCNDNGSTRDILIQGNQVHDSLTGYTINGGCFVTFRDNLASGMRAPGAAVHATANGFTCGRDGEGSQWIDNTSVGNQRSGYAINCSRGDEILFSGNISENNCLGDTFSDPDVPVQASDITFVGPDSTPWLDDLIIEDVDRQQGQDGACEYGMFVMRRTRVQLTGGSIEGGTEGGLMIQGAKDVAAEEGFGMEVEDIEITSTQASGDVGVFFNFAETMEHVYVQPTADVTGFATTGDFNGGHYHGDGDDVAFCAEEPASPGPPAGCDTP